MRFPNVSKCVLSGAAMFSMGLATMGASLASTPPDDSVTINEGIDVAIKSGQSSYSIPAGTYTLTHPIVIPPGTSNFTLEGAGSANTKLIASSALLAYPGYAILAGEQVELNNWGLTNVEPGASIANVKTGDQTVQLTTTNIKFTVGEYAVILDSNQIWTAAANITQGQLNRAELTRIVAVNKSTNTVTLDVPAAREYNDSPMIYACSNLISTNIAVRGFSFNGSVSGSSTRNNGILNADLIDGLTVSDMLVNDYQDRAIQTDIVRNGNMSGLTITNGADIQNEGDGYGLTFCRSRMIQVSNSSANSTRHAFICTNGTTDVTFTNCSAVVMANGLNDFNTHGFDERRIHYVGCVGTMAFANPSWLGGAEGFTVQNCQSIQGIYFGPNATNMTITGSTVGPIEFDSKSATKGIPSSGYANGISFSKCDIIGNWAIGKDLVEMGTATFTSCYFESTVASWGGPIWTPANAIGNLVFNQCDMVDDSASSPIMLTAASDLYVSLNSCTLTSKLGALAAFNLVSGYMNLSVVDNTFNTLKPKNAAQKVLFIDVPKNAKLTSVNNVCVDH